MCLTRSYKFGMGCDCLGKFGGTSIEGDFSNYNACTPILLVEAFVAFTSSGRRHSLANQLCTQASDWSHAMGRFSMPGVLFLPGRSSAVTPRSVVSNSARDTMEGLFFNVCSQQRQPYLLLRSHICLG